MSSLDLEKQYHFADLQSSWTRADIRHYFPTHAKQILCARTRYVRFFVDGSTCQINEIGYYHELFQQALSLAVTNFRAYGWNFVPERTARELSSVTWPLLRAIKKAGHDL